MRTPLTDDVRKEAFAYVDEVLGRARGVAREREGAAEAAASLTRKPLLARLVPRFVKRALVRALIYVMRHPFDHLAHSLQVRLEEEIGQSRGIAQAALTRVEQMGAELRRLRTELERERRNI